MKKINKASCVMAFLAATALTGCNNSLDETVYSEILEQSYNYQKIGQDKSKLARIQYKGKGKYIEEILV